MTPTQPLLHLLLDKINYYAKEHDFYIHVFISRHDGKPLWRYAIEDTVLIEGGGFASFEEAAVVAIAKADSIHELIGGSGDKTKMTEGTERNKRKTFQERLVEEEAKKKYAAMLKEQLDIDEQAAEAAAKQAYDLKQHDHQRTREIEEEVMKNRKPKAYTLDEVKDEMIGEQGTPERDAYDSKLLINLFAEKVAKLASEHKPFVDIGTFKDGYIMTFDLGLLGERILQLRDKFLDEIEHKKKHNIPL